MSGRNRIVSRRCCCRAVEIIANYRLEKIRGLARVSASLLAALASDNGEPGSVPTRRAPSPETRGASVCGLRRDGARCEFESRDSIIVRAATREKADVHVTCGGGVHPTRDERQRSHPPRRVPMGIPDARRLRHASTPAHFQGE